MSNDRFEPDMFERIWQTKMAKLSAVEKIRLIKDYLEDDEEKLICLSQVLQGVPYSEGYSIEECLSSINLAQVSVQAVQSFSKAIEGWNAQNHRSKNKNIVYEIQVNFDDAYVLLQNYKTQDRSVWEEKGKKCKKIFNVLSGSIGIFIDPTVVTEWIKHTPKHDVEQLVEHLPLKYSNSVWEAWGEMQHEDGSGVLESAWMDRWFKYVVEIKKSVQNGQLDESIYNSYGSYQAFDSYSLRSEDFQQPSASVKARVKELLLIDQWEEAAEGMSKGMSIQSAKNLMKHVEQWVQNMDRKDMSFVDQSVCQLMQKEQVHLMLQGTLLNSSDQELMHQYLKTIKHIEELGLNLAEVPNRREKGKIQYHWLAQVNNYPMAVSVAQGVQIKPDLWLYASAQRSDDKDGTSLIQMMRTVDAPLVDRLQEQWDFLVQNHLVGAPFAADALLEKTLKAESFSALVQKSALLQNVKVGVNEAKPTVRKVRSV